MEDPEVRSKVLWEGMQLVEPWENEEVSDDIFTINPTFLPRDRLSAAQQSVGALLPTAAVHHPVTVCKWLPGRAKPWGRLSTGAYEHSSADHASDCRCSSVLQTSTDCATSHFCSMIC